MRLLVFAVAFAAGACCTASPLTGTWEARFPCPPASVEQCRRGTPDVFTLRLRVEGTVLCGTHSSVAQFGNRVDEPNIDEPSIVGDVQGSIAKVDFTSSFGGKGTAMLRLERGFLHWRIESEGEGESWLPPSAVLRRARDTAWRDSLRCTVPAAPGQ